MLRPVTSVATAHTPDSLAARLAGEPGLVVLRSDYFDSPQARYSFVAVRPLLIFRSHGWRCEFNGAGAARFGNPWNALAELMARYEVADDGDLPFPLGGCFGYWGYDLNHLVQSRRPRAAVNDLELPDCHAGFYDSLVVFDHRLHKTWIISTGLRADGSRSADRAREQFEFWAGHLAAAPNPPAPAGGAALSIRSNLSRDAFVAGVRRVQEYIRAGDVYQVNLSHRLTAAADISGWDFFQRLRGVSPAPFAAHLDCGEFQICSSSPELFMRLSGAAIHTRPIKGTRPRSSDAALDARLTGELQTSPKEMAELVMITDLMRNDLGKVCEYGSVQVPELARLERYPQVQHLVSSVTGQLRADQTHLSAFASCFPGGSVTGAPKIRAMEIIDELEPVTRGPYTGAIGYLGFNRQSQFSVAIRTAICRPGEVHFQVGAGIVTDSVAEAEYDETMDKAAGFLAALQERQ